jgi:hypothetical protein
LKIYLLLLDHARFFFYSDEKEASRDSADSDQESTRPSSGLFARLRARYTTFRVAWQHADSGALLWMRRSWDWLHSWAHPDEAMLSRLWSARRIDLHYPAARSVDQIRATWSDYLRTQWRRHLLWLIVNGVIAPFSIVFAILPGPNLIGYWFAYRAIHHTLVVWGIGRVLRNMIPTEFSPLAALDLPIERNNDGKSSHAALIGAAPRLDDHVAWHSSPRRASTLSELTVEPVPAGPAPANSRTEPF